MPETLTELQLDLLSILWRRGESTIVDVHEALRRERRVSQATVATVLARLEKRGLVSRRREGKAHLYRAAVEEGDVARRVTREFSARTRPLFHGNIAQMVGHLLESEDVDPEDLREAEKLLARAQRQLEREGD